MLRRCFLIAVTVILLGGFCGALASEQAGEKSAGKPMWRFEFANDVIFDSDNQFSNGFTVQRHSQLFDNLEEISGLPISRWLAKRILPDREGLYYRNGFTIGQNMQTPDEIENPDLILNDVPYFGMLGAGNTWVAYNDSRFYGFEVVLGITGEESFADELQKAVHTMIDSEDPEGWDHQLDTEPLLNVYYMYKRKLWRNPTFDGAVSLDVGAGNFFTGATVALETRFGKMPKGFTYAPSPLGVALHYDATLPDSRRTLVYGSIIVRASGFAVMMARDGNILVNNNEWTDANVIDPKDVVGAVVVGFHFVRPEWGLHFNYWLGTDTVDDENFAVPDDPSNDFSTFVVEWKF
jgi:lipid A 3-O-deacylase